MAIELVGQWADQWVDPMDDQLDGKKVGWWGQWRVVRTDGSWVVWKDSW